MSWSLKCRFFKKGNDGKAKLLDEGWFDSLKCLCDYSYSARLDLECAEGDIEWLEEFLNEKNGDYCLYDRRSFLTKFVSLENELKDLNSKIDKMKKLECSIDFFKLSEEEKDDYYETVGNLAEEKAELESQIYACNSALALFDWTEGKGECWGNSVYMELRVC